MDASGAAASNCNEAVAHVESDQIQEIIIETPDEDLVANNTMIPELFSKANNAEKRTGMTLQCGNFYKFSSSFRRLTLLPPLPLNFEI